MAWVVAASAAFAAVRSIGAAASGLPVSFSTACPGTAPKASADFDDFSPAPVAQSYQPAAAPARPIKEVLGDDIPF